MDSPKKGFAASVLIEVVIALVLIVLIFFTLNYFGIVSVSKKISFLAFLPVQSKTVPSAFVNKSETNVKSSTVKSVIDPANPLTVENKGAASSYSHISSSSAELSRGITINLQLSLNNATAASGVIFNNSLKGDQYRGIRIFRNAAANNWMFEYKWGDKLSLTFLSKSNSGEDFRNFVININKNGDSVTVMLPSISNIGIKLPVSFYASDKNVINGVIQVASKSKVEIYSLFYQI
ncbi:MAG TPA: hypothetical protein VHE53_02520 [Patescibacteria group bacterium]|nr:hypothetical protein [Patescibacteria group bacterium]